MGLILLSLLVSFLLFAGMLACGVAGRRLAIKRAARDPDGARGGGVVDGAVFALLGLIIAFSFAGAMARFDERRHLAVEEVNAIGTAYLRVDLAPAASQPALRESMRRYVDSRITLYRDLPDIDAAKAELESSDRLQTEIWALALAASRDSQAVAMLLLPALNQMFDIRTTRTWVLFMHPPPVILVMFISLALIAAGLAGYGTARTESPDWLRMVAFAAVTAFAFNVIVDIEFPRAGLIQVDAFDRPLMDLRNSMN